MILSVTPMLLTVIAEDGGESLLRSGRGVEFLTALVIFLLLSTSPVLSRGRLYSTIGATTGKLSGEMTKPTEVNNGDSPALFYEVLRKSLKKRKTSIESICPSADPVSRRVLEDYGAIFIAKHVMPPPVCVFTTEEEVTRFQESAGYTSEMLGFHGVGLQPQASKQLLNPGTEAQREDREITPP